MSQAGAEGGRLRPPLHRLGVWLCVLQRRLQGGLHPVRTTCVQSIAAPTVSWLQVFGHTTALCTKTAMNITLSHPQITCLRSYIYPRAFGSRTEMEGSRLPADLAQAVGVGGRVGGLGSGREEEVGGSSGAVWPLPQIRGSFQLLLPREAEPPGTGPSWAGSAEGICWAWPGQWSRDPELNLCLLS